MLSPAISSPSSERYDNNIYLKKCKVIHINFHILTIYNAINIDNTDIIYYLERGKFVFIIKIILYNMIITENRAIINFL